jgi:hypothetical protein
MAARIHEVEMPDTKTYLIPPEGDPKVGQEVFRVLSIIIADKVKLGLHERWFRNYQLRRNKPWKSNSPQGVPLVSGNLLFTHQQRTVNTLTDNNPTFNVAIVGKLEEGQGELLMDLQRCTEHWWNDQEQQDVLETSCHNGEEYGPAIEKVKFNPDLEYGIGEVETIPIDPFHFGWYPVKMANARDLQNREAVVHFYPESVRKLKAKYPNKADKIKPDKEILKQLYEDDRREIGGGDARGSGGSTFVSIASAVKELINFLSGSGNEQDEDDTLLCEMWLRDRSTASKEEKGKNGDTIKTSQPKYTGEIRYILACSGDVVLEDRDNPNINPNLSQEEAQQTYLYDKVPFCIVNSIKDTSSAWGFSDYEQLEWLLMEMNKSLSQFTLEKDRAARKKLILPKDSGVQRHEMTNYVGIIEPSSTQAATGIRWLETPPSSVDYDKAIALFKDLFFLISGTFELDQAQVKGREVIAYKAIAALLERSATMMRGKIRAYSRLIRERGRMYVSMVQNFYTEERWISYQENGVTQSKPINGANLRLPAKLTVVSGSTMPISRVQQREEAVTLYEKGAIDQQELLDKLDWGNRAEVIKRVQAGMFGPVIEKLAQTGLPAPFIEYFKSIAGADPKQLQKALKTGEFPTFPQFFQQILAEMQGQAPAEGDQGQAAEFAERQAKVKQSLAAAEKLIAERDLIIEKTATERIMQQVKAAGVQFDEESLKMQRAKIVADIEDAIRSHDREGFKAGLDFISAQNNKPGYNERGIRSNNQEV